MVVTMDLKSYLSFDQSKQHFYQCISLLPADRTLNVAPTTVCNKDGLNKTIKQRISTCKSLEDFNTMEAFQIVDENIWDPKVLQEL